MTSTTTIAESGKGEPMELMLQAITLWLIIQLLFTIWNLRQMPKLGNELHSYGWEQQYDCSQQNSNIAHTHTYSDTVTDSSRAATSSAKSINSSSEEKPMLSVLIPVRNEEVNIRECLESVLACRTDSIELEVLVINDHSEDGTAEEVRHVIEQDSRVQLYEGQPLPKGWMGKSYACHQLSQKAQGEWWLFVDADVRLGPEALEAAMITARSQQTGMISGFPRMETGTWLERLVVPMMAFVIGYHLPIMMVRRSPRPFYLAVTGAWMMIHRNSYIRCGGHKHIFNHIVEDMELAKAVKKAGDPVTLADVQRHTSARMYRNAAQVWEGYKKNMFAGTGRNPLLVLCITVLYTLLFLWPVIMLVYGLVTIQPDVIGWSAAAIIIGMLSKGIIDHHSGKPFWMGVLLPVSALCMILILLDSWLAGIRGKGYSWKGRTYG
ncbi:glycosyltransferase [Paenibacillus dauci]|uniref:glycosyltransferase n=1 Tax=Paenibacillus dauci TaxID=1567106 RepID=UPI0009E58B76|nr:glycosyltransferase [Paenibacillus dauci]